MKITNTFWIPRAPSVAWPLLNDIERVAPCVPGAELLEITDDGRYIGRVGVRLGPVALAFKGAVHYVARDDAAMTAQLEAQGQEERARGTARSTVHFALVPDGEGSCVTVDTHLTLAGAIAQYARGVGMVQSTAQLMLDDFARSLEDMLANDVSEEVIVQDAAVRAKEISGLRLIARVIARWIGGLFGRRA